MIKIGLLGCGNVGHIIAHHSNDIKIVALYDILPERAKELARVSGAAAFDDFSLFLSQDFDLVVEAASVSAVTQYGEEILNAGKDLVVLSVGAFSDTEFRERLTGIAREKGRTIYIPSGAIIGLDNLKIGQIAKIDRLLLRTTKSPASLGIECDQRMMVFKGRADECIRQYPKNINVAVALGLAAGRDADVELWVDPELQRNIHEIFADGEFGEIYIRVKNTPSPENPSTSYMAALSILTLLKNLNTPFVVGT